MNGDTNPQPGDTLNALRGFVFLDLAVRLAVYLLALTAALTTLLAIKTWPVKLETGASFSAAWEWSAFVGIGILLFNLFYVALLVFFRLPIPQPKPGEYTLVPGKIPAPAMIWSCLIATLTKARYEAPFPGFLVFHISNLPPLCWLMSRIFGPRSKSCYVTDPGILDPHLVTIGRNVVIGFGSCIAGHFQDRDRVVIRESIIEDDVLIGAMSAMSGVHIKRGAIIGAGSILMPGTVVGEGEFWSGNPARRRQRPAPTASASKEQRRQLAELASEESISPVGNQPSAAS